MYIDGKNAENFLNNNAGTLGGTDCPPDETVPDGIGELATINPNAKTPIGREYIVTGEQCQGEECELEIASMAPPFFTAIGFCLFWYFVAPLVAGHSAKRKKIKKKR